MAGGVSSSEGNKSYVKVVANIFISFIGAGVLGLPFAFKEAGVIEGIGVMVFVGVVSVKAMLLVIDCKYYLLLKSPPSSSASNTPTHQRKVVPANATASEMEDLMGDGLAEGDLATTVVKPEEKKPVAAPGTDLTYGDVGYYAMGNSGLVLVEACILVSQIGFCCAYLIFIGENLTSFFPSRSIYTWLAILLPLEFLLSMFRNLSKLAITSLVAQLSNLMAFAVVVFFDFEHMYIVHELHIHNISMEGLPFFLCIAIYCYEGAGMILSLESSFHKDIRHRFKPIFLCTLAVVTLLYIAFGLCGYLSFGEGTDEIITLNLPQDGHMVFLVKMCLCLALFFTYPVMLIPVFRILDSKLGFTDTVWKGNCLRLFVVFLTGVVVVMVPNFATLMGLIGASCCTLLAFILPGLFHMKIKGQDLTRWETAVDFFLIGMGIIGGVVGLLDAFKRMSIDNAQAQEEAASAAATAVSQVGDLASSIVQTSYLNSSHPKLPGLLSGNTTT